jgi:sugar phosphate permease
MQEKKNPGFASGLVNTSYQIGFALGLAIMVAIGSTQTILAINSSVGSIDALNNGFHLAFITAAIVAAIAAIVAFLAIKKPHISGRKEEAIVAAGTGEDQFE